MERLYVYDGALALIGLSVIVQTAVTGDNAALTAFVAVSGGAMVVGAGYDALRRDPAEFAVPAGAVLALVVAAGIAVCGALLNLALAA
ncbi:hypothetical protein [Salarchaeum japonicum]|uniref:Uncharacterized protein n=1 Tax=Salarchaeum japonicum TaxID=555573 RepID=A0AAV3T102_9EURY|nr:hypothetical protein [Salarchaeum japonicum]